MDTTSIVSKAIRGMVDTGVKYEHRNGRVIFKTRKTPDPPWRFFSFDPRMKCTLWKWVMYKGIVEGTPGLDFAPSPCHDCYKVVVVPGSLHELKNVEEAMSDICHVGFTGKCGIERRKHVTRNYGAYFYCRGEEEAHNRTDMIRKVIPKRIPIHIQHSGTYYMSKQGDPSSWVITEQQLQIEDEIMRQADTDQNIYEQTPQDIAMVHNLWKQFAYKVDLII